MDPAELVLLTDHEYRNCSEKFVRYHPELPLHWHPGLEIVGDEVTPTLLPATLAVLRFSWTHTDERFAPSLSPGLASGTDLTRALLHGVYELIERDAFAMAWLLRRVGRQLDIAALPDPALDASRARLAEDGYALTFVELTNDVGVPVVLAVISRPDNPYLAVGLGANVSIAHAAARAYAEALENLVNFYDFPTQAAPGSATSWSPTATSIRSPIARSASSCSAPRTIGRPSPLTKPNSWIPGVRFAGASTLFAVSARGSYSPT